MTQKTYNNQEAWTSSPEHTPLLLDWHDLPQQRINEVVCLPERPKGFFGQHVFLKPFEAEPKRGPRKTLFLGTAEWSWSPMNHRIDNYYLSQNKKYWFLWNHFYNDFDPPYKWEWHLYAAAKKVKNADDYTAALYLLHDFWKVDSQNESIGHFHFITNTDLISVEDFQALGRLIW